MSSQEKNLDQPSGGWDADEALRILSEYNYPTSKAEKLRHDVVIGLPISLLGNFLENPGEYILGFSADDSKGDYAGITDTISGHSYRGEGRYTSIDVLVIKPFIATRALYKVLNREPKAHLYIDERWNTQATAD